MVGSHNVPDNGARSMIDGISLLWADLRLFGARFEEESLRHTRRNEMRTTELLCEWLAM